MDFDKIVIFGSYISKEYSREFLRLLATYSDISASEAASRLDIHIKTAQDFLEGMAEAGILSRERVQDRARPYYRFSLINRKAIITLDFDSLAERKEKSTKNGKPALRESRNSGIRFVTSRFGPFFTSVIIPVGEGRTRSERKISLTPSQGKLLFHLPFPGADPMTLDEMMTKGGLEEETRAELSDIINLMTQYGVIESIY